ncbi:MAG: tRNA (adenosine(37)-N6)-threonylcarbamoyltransferase complex ATPase subunit type 1 TsaE [Tepidisphaeraceae bacterium]|jgi:tRNA threonylcarbamoyladenosine biosynthesis protein TsaE
MIERQSNSVEETESIAGELAATLVAGDCVALIGDLGAGKTQFVRGIATALGANPRAVSSPTFVLLNIYPGGRLTVYHLDAYRTSGAADLEAIGLPEIFQQGGMALVEWADRVPEILPENRIEVRIVLISETQRRITIERIGPGNTVAPISRDGA